MIFDTFYKNARGKRCRQTTVMCDGDKCREREDFPGSCTVEEAAARVRDKFGWGIVCVRAERPKKFKHYCPICDRLTKVPESYIKWAVGA